MVLHDLFHAVPRTGPLSLPLLRDDSLERMSCFAPAHCCASISTATDTALLLPTVIVASLDHQVASLKVPIPSRREFLTLACCHFLC